MMLLKVFFIFRITQDLIHRLLKLLNLITDLICMLYDWLFKGKFRRLFLLFMIHEIYLSAFLQPTLFDLHFPFDYRYFVTIFTDNSVIIERSRPINHPIDQWIISCRSVLYRIPQLNFSLTDFQILTLPSTFPIFLKQTQKASILSQIIIHWQLKNISIMNFGEMLLSIIAINNDPDLIFLFMMEVLIQQWGEL